MRSIAFTGIITFVPLYAIRVVHASVPQANTALAALLVCGAIGTVIGGRIIDRIGRIPVLLISMFSAGPLLVAFIVATSSGAPYALAGCIAIAGLVGLLFIPSQTAFVVLAQEYLPNHLGVAAGVSLGLAISLGGAAAPLLGRLGDVSGLTATMWANVALIGIAGILAIALALVSRRPNRTAQDHTSFGNPSEASASKTTIPTDVERLMLRTLCARIGIRSARSGYLAINSAGSPAVSLPNTIASPWR